MIDDLNWHFLTHRFNIVKLDAFYRSHIRSCQNYSEYRIRTYSSGIGCCADIKCEICKANEDVSDYDHW